MEGQIRCLRLELETRLSIEVTPVMGVWPLLVRHNGWLRERYHVKDNKKTAFEDCFGKPYQGEVMSCPRVERLVAESGRDEQMRDLSVEYGFGKTTESDEQLFANELGVCTTRTVKRVPYTEQKRADLVKDLQGTPWDRLAGRPAGRPRKTTPQAPSVPTPPLAKESERPSEDASERRSAQAQDVNIPAVPHVIPVLRAADTENEPISSSSRPMETEDGSAQKTTQPTTTVRKSDRQLQQTDQSAKTQRETELQGGKFQQVEGLTTADAEVIPCEFSVQDDFMTDENTDGVDEEIVKAIVAGKKKGLDAMEAFGIFEVCEELPRDAKVITTRWENVPKGD